jgi:hypothetical protein
VEHFPFPEERMMVTNRSWQWFVLASALVLTVAVAVVGCGGGGAATTTTVSVPGSPGGAVTTVAPGGSGSEFIGRPLTPTSETPAEITDAISQHRPIVILFYVPGGTDDSVVLDEIKALQTKYTDVTFALYDYKSPTSYGDLGILLKVAYPPQTVFIDTRGTIYDIRTGYVDEGTLNQQVVNIRQG